MTEKSTKSASTAWWIYRQPEKKGALAPEGMVHPDVVKSLDVADAPPWRKFGAKANLIRGTRFKPEPSEIESINAALYLRRPLLITGKPGTGKTSLAYAVANQLGLGEVLRWSITSRTQLNDGLYQYDAIARLQDVQLSNEDVSIDKYLKLGPLGTAFLGVEQDGKYYPRVLLIDEIDKSDIDLPNDLLHIFEEGEFEIAELKRQTTAKAAVKLWGSGEPVIVEEGRVVCRAFPLVIMTSNGEREFPPAFLRRCLPLEMKPPSADKLKQIVCSHFGDNFDNLSAIDDLIGQFIARRDQQNHNLTTDQLLNAIYLVFKDIDISGGIRPFEDKQLLIDIIWKSLSNEDLGF